jgi:DNA-binding response OmpR family regulator
MAEPGDPRPEPAGPPGAPGSGRARANAVLIVEDQPELLRALRINLRARQYDVVTARTGREALALAASQPPDAVILDLGLPDIEGLELLKMLRAVSAVPVIAATARDDEREIVRTLDAGADDYVIKPYSADQLEARLRAVLRRVGSPQSDTLIVGKLHIDTASRVASLDGNVLDLSRKEFDLLAHLARNPGRVATKRELLAEIWDQPYGGSDKTVDVHLSWLRRKLGETATEPRYLRAVRGVGVKLVDPDT